MKPAPIKIPSLFVESYTPPQVEISKMPGIANMKNEIIEVTIILLLALLKNK